MKLAPFWSYGYEATSVALSDGLALQVLVRQRRRHQYGHFDSPLYLCSSSSRCSPWFGAYVRSVTKMMSDGSRNVIHYWIKWMFVARLTLLPISESNSVARGRIRPSETESVWLFSVSSGIPDEFDRALRVAKSVLVYTANSNKLYLWTKKRQRKDVRLLIQTKKVI